MRFKGTPGPWEQKDGFISAEREPHGDDYIWAIAHVMSKDDFLGPPKVRARANAALIAEAPAMVEALYALGAEAQDIQVHQGGDVDASIALADLLKIINEKVSPILRELHAGGAI